MNGALTQPPSRHPSRLSPLRIAIIVVVVVGVVLAAVFTVLFLAGTPKSGPCPVYSACPNTVTERVVLNDTLGNDSRGLIEFWVGGASATALVITWSIDHMKSGPPIVPDCSGCTPGVDFIVVGGGTGGTNWTVQTNGSGSYPIIGTGPYLVSAQLIAIDWYYASADLTLVAAASD